MIARVLPPGIAASWHQLRADLSAIVDHLSDCFVVLGESVNRSEAFPDLIEILAASAECMASLLIHAAGSATATPKTQKEYLKKRKSGKEHVSGQDRASSPRFPALQPERKSARTKMQVSSSTFNCLSAASSTQTMQKPVTRIHATGLVPSIAQRNRRHHEPWRHR
jgi:hypothetical protein